MSQQMVQYISQIIASVTQPVQKRHVTEFGDPGIGGETGGAAQRELARTIEQGQMQQVRGGTNATFAEQGTVRPRAGVQIDQGRDVADDAEPLVQPGGCVLYQPRESRRF